VISLYITDQQEFLDSGLSPESADRAGYTAIHAASSYGHIDLLRFLIKERNGDINVQDAEGDTPLHMCEFVGIARTMIEEFGADVSIRNKEGLTAAESVREEGDFDDLAEFLESVTPGAQRVDNDTSALAYTEFREDEDGDTQGESDDDTADDEGEVGTRVVGEGRPQISTTRIDEILRLEEQDGVNRDEELRSIVTEAIMRQMGRAPDGNSNGTNNGTGRRPRRE
jgi:hypothetical protein